MLTTTTGSLQSIIANVINFINEFLVPLVFALAFAFFLFGMFRFFFVKNDAAARKEGRAFIFSSVVAFAVMISIWGLVNLLSGTFSLNYNQPNLPTFNASGSGASMQGASTGLPGASSAQPASMTGASSQPSPTSSNCTNGNCDDVQGLY